MQPRQQKLVTETPRSEILYDFISRHLGGKLMLDIDISKYSYFESRQFLSTSVLNLWEVKSGIELACFDELFMLHFFMWFTLEYNHISDHK